MRLTLQDRHLLKVGESSLEGVELLIRDLLRCADAAYTGGYKALSRAADSRHHEFLSTAVDLLIRMDFKCRNDFERLLDIEIIARSNSNLSTLSMLLIEEAMLSIYDRQKPEDLAVYLVKYLGLTLGEDALLRELLAGLSTRKPD